MTTIQDPTRTRLWAREVEVTEEMLSNWDAYSTVVQNEWAKRGYMPRSEALRVCDYAANVLDALKEHHTHTHLITQLRCVAKMLRPEDPNA